MDFYRSHREVFFWGVGVSVWLLIHAGFLLGVGVV